MKESIKKTLVCLGKYNNIWKALLMSALPLLACIIACASQGRTIGEVYLPAGEWNDELFYFKQVEGIVNFGYPQGYFGFNESHALKASFAAWSPVLVFPWIIWGLVFGWNLSSPIYCNIFLMMLAMFLFVWLVKPGRKQLGILTILYVTFTPLTRYLLSGMPECICFAMVIIVLALNISYQEKAHVAKLVLLFVMTSVMTLMRPYLLLFMLLPMYYLIRRKKWLGAVGSVAVVGVTGIVYVLVKHYFGAEYFTPLFDVTWVTTFFDQGIWAGVKYIVWRILHKGIEFFRLMIEGFRSGLFWGEYFGAFMIVTIVLLIHTLRDWLRKDHKGLTIRLYLSVCFVGMWTALLLMYKMKEGSKHLLTFIVVGIFAISLMETRFYKKLVVTAAVFVYLFTATSTDAYEHQVPFVTEELVERGKYWEKIFAGECILSQENTPNFDNVMIWIFNDKVGDTYALTPYQMLYQLPVGYGISCCYADYVKENIDTLQSRFLAVAAGGEIDQLCQDKELREIGRDEGLVVYELFSKAK